MRRGTTPTYTINLGQGMGALVDEIVITFVQDATEVELKYSTGAVSVNEDLASCTLTQAQTLSFKRGLLVRQAKVKFGDGTVETSDAVTEDVVEDLHGEAI